ncbi:MULTISPECIES: molecular chaperone [unclassified Raoultella]|uniref:fimbrial biogenesis chaperone n=1 Tax=unclassified Raoultella TaxID=2627600 RepID=UPI00135AC8A5|nr:MULTISPECIES: molecular chaperone [unclassified Raoultella]
MTFIAKLASLFLVFFLTAPTAAGTYINFTRLVVSEQEREVTFSIINEGNSAVLMQLWTDRDNYLDRPEVIRMPFLIQPPVFRLNGHDSRTVRLQLAGDRSALPTDRESLFWLNALEIPPEAAGASKGENSLLQVAFRTRIKLFYRPAALANITPEESVKNVVSTTTRCDGKICLKLNNPSPLHYTLLKITLDNGDEIGNLPADSMLLPRSSLSITLPPSATLRTQLKSLTWIDDYGVERSYSGQ